MPAMHNDEPIFCANADRPRHPHQEIADLLAVALLRLRDKDSAFDHSTASETKDAVILGFPAHQRVNANPDQQQGVRA
jgi:BarA-like signal transduction histidine kinase